MTEEKQSAGDPASRRGLIPEVSRLTDSTDNFEARKRDHIRHAMNPDSQTILQSDFYQFQLIHDALPELDWDEIETSRQVFGRTIRFPFLISSMTAGHKDSARLNEVLVEGANRRGWMFAVGSQRRELFDPSASQEWGSLRRKFTDTVLLGNIGLSQAIALSTEKIQRLVEGLGASALFVHLNPLQECIQKEGTPYFKSGRQTLERLSRELKVPVLVKETGSGISHITAQKLKGLGLFAVEVSGLGGTHWGRIEKMRGDYVRNTFEANESQWGFSNWGVPTGQSILESLRVEPDFEVWGSGGVRNGVQAATLIAMGARAVGFAQPALEAAMQGPEGLNRWMEQIEKDFCIAMFCTGSRDLAALSDGKKWRKS